MLFDHFPQLVTVVFSEKEQKVLEYRTGSLNGIFHESLSCQTFQQNIVASQVFLFCFKSVPTLTNAGKLLIGAEI